MSRLLRFLFFGGRGGSKKVFCFLLQRAAEELEVMTADRKRDAPRRQSGISASLNEPLRGKPGFLFFSGREYVSHNHTQTLWVFFFCASVICSLLQGPLEFKGALYSLRVAYGRPAVTQQRNLVTRSEQRNNRQRRFQMCVPGATST